MNIFLIITFAILGALCVMAIKEILDTERDDKEDESSGF